MTNFKDFENTLNSDWQDIMNGKYGGIKQQEAITLYHSGEMLFEGNNMRKFVEDTVGHTCWKHKTTGEFLSHDKEFLMSFNTESKEKNEEESKND